jgi:hypothetical protein
MALKLGFRDQVFDDVTPLYIEVGGGEVINRLTGKRLNRASLVAEMTTEEYTPKTGEMAPAPEWLQSHQGPWAFMSGADVDITVAGLPAAAGGGEATLVVETYGRNTAEALTLDASFKLGANPDVAFSVELPAGSSGEDIVTAITSAAQWASNDQTLEAVGSTITVTNGDADDDLVALSAGLS